MTLYLEDSGEFRAGVGAVDTRNVESHFADCSQPQTWKSGGASWPRQSPSRSAQLFLRMAGFGEDSRG